jgi:peptidoglycan/xylan/chitin deacetylase (PgdA/CDA1 family)
MHLISFVVGVLLVSAVLSSAQNQTLIFRLDDLQCGWLTDLGLTIISIFMDNKIPLVVGIITLDDVSCFTDVLPQMYDDSDGLLEIASHSQTHPQMVSLTLAQQLVEVNESKIAIESFLGQGTVRTFIPPFNGWNYDTITAVVQSGYDIFSPECTGGDVGHTEPDNVCTSNMYENRPAFFPRIDGVTHVPIGAAISNFNNEQQLLTASEIFYGTLDDCYAGSCSVELQVGAMAPLTNGDPDQNWSSIMMHPDCFPENSDRTYLENYFAPIFDIAVQFKLKTFTQLAGAVGSRPLVKGIRTPP